MSGFPDRAGLQPERTALAWQRTAITALVLLVPSIAFMFVVERFLRADVLARVGR